jgi:hypothetical protein
MHSCYILTRSKCVCLKKKICVWGLHTSLYPSYWEQGIRISVGGQPRQKVHQTSSQPKAGSSSDCLSPQLCGEARRGGQGPGQLETRVLDPRPRLLRFHLPTPATAPKRQIKRHGEGRERRFITWLGTCHGRGRVSTQSVFSHLWGTHMSYRFKNWGQGIRVCIAKQSQS